MESRLRKRETNDEDRLDAGPTIENTPSMDKIWEMVNETETEDNVPDIADYDIDDTSIESDDETTEDTVDDGNPADTVRSKAMDAMSSDDDDKVKAFLDSLDSDDLSITKYGTGKDKEPEINEDDSVDKQAMKQIINETMGRMNNGNAAAQDFRKYAGRGAINSSPAYGIACMVAMVIGFIVVVVNAFSSGLPIPFIGRYNLVIGMVLIVGGGMFLRAWDADERLDR